MILHRPLPWATRQDTGELCPCRGELVRTAVCNLGCMKGTTVPVYFCHDKNMTVTPYRFDQPQTLECCLGCDHAVSEPSA